MPTTTPVQYPIPAATARRKVHFSRAKLPPTALIPVPAIAEAIERYHELVSREKATRSERRSLIEKRRDADESDRAALKGWHEKGGKGPRPDPAAIRQELEARIARAEEDEDALGDLTDEADRDLRAELEGVHGRDLVAKLTEQREAARSRFTKALEKLEQAKNELDGNRSTVSWAKGPTLPPYLTNASTGASRHLRQFTPAPQKLDGVAWADVLRALRSLASPPEDPPRAGGAEPLHTEVDLHATDALKRDT